MQEDLTHELDSGTESRVWNGCLTIITIFFNCEACKLHTQPTLWLTRTLYK